jgi:iron complex outermembrane recepter protein
MKKYITALLFGATALLCAQNKNTTIKDSIHKNQQFVMDEVLITSVFNKLQSQNVMKVAHQSIKEMNKNGATTLIEGVANIPGVSQISTGTAIGKPVIRGLSSNRVLVYSQGVRIENQQFGEEHGLGLNDSGLEGVEVIKGPASLLYGSDAMGGVLYFNPEKFANSNQFSSDFGQKINSNTNGLQTQIGAKFSEKNWKFLSRASFSTHADYQIPDKERVTNTRFNETDYKTGVGYSKDNFSSVLRYNFNKLDIGLPENGIAQQTTTKITDFPKQAIENNLLSLNSVLKLNNSKIDLNLGYIDNNRKEFVENGDPALYLKLKTFNYDAKYYLPKFNNIETVFGLQGMLQTNTNFGSEYLIPDAKTTDVGLYGSTNIETKTVSIQTGVRFDNRKISTQALGNFPETGSLQAINKSFDSFNFALGLKSNWSKKLVFRLNFASGFRAPNLSELSSNGVHEGTIRYEIGNSNLTTEQNFQTDLNIDYKNDHFEFFVNGFFNQIKNYIFIQPTAYQIDTYDVFEYTQKNANFFGGEFGLHFHPHPLDWLHFVSSFETVTAIDQQKNYLPQIPANKWNNEIRTDFKNLKWLNEGYFSFNIVHFFQQNNTSLFETKTNDYTLINLAIGGKIKLNKTNFNVNLNAINILDKTYYSHLSRFKNDGIPNIGRNFILGVSFNIFDQQK